VLEIPSTVPGITDHVQYAFAARGVWIISDAFHFLWISFRLYTVILYVQSAVFFSSWSADRCYSVYLRCRGWKCVELYLHPLPHTPSWRGAQLSIGIVPYFTLLQLELTPWNRVLL